MVESLYIPCLCNQFVQLRFNKINKIIFSVLLQCYFSNLTRTYTSVITRDEPAKGEDSKNKKGNVKKERCKWG